MPTFCLAPAPAPLPSRSKIAASVTSIKESDRKLTIHRRTSSHHGRTLRILGHAAEHLTSSINFSRDNHDTAATLEAIHILLRLSREVFDDYARTNDQHHPVADWLMRQAVRVYGAA